MLCNVYCKKKQTFVSAVYDDDERRSGSRRKKTELCG